MCILLCLLFATKAVYVVAIGSGYLRSEEAQYRTPIGVPHVAAEFVVHLTTELVPSAMLLFFMRRRINASADRSLATSATFPPHGLMDIARDNADHLPSSGSSSQGNKARGFGSYGAMTSNKGPFHEESASMLGGNRYQVGVSILNHGRGGVMYSNASVLSSCPDKDTAPSTLATSRQTPSCAAAFLSRKVAKEGFM